MVDGPGLRASALLPWAALVAAATGGIASAAIVVAYTAYSIERQAAVGLSDVPAALLTAVPFAILAKLGHRASRHAAAIPGAENPRAALSAAREIVGWSVVPLVFGLFFSVGLGFLDIGGLSGSTPLAVHMAQLAVLLCLLAEVATMVIAAVARSRGTGA